MEEKITLQYLIDALAEKNGISKKKADTFVRTMFEVIEKALAEDKYVKIKGFGTFKLTEVDSRESVDVNTGERIEIEGHARVSFTPDAGMKELINKPFAHFETVILNENTQLEDTETVDYKEVLSEEGLPQLGEEKIVDIPSTANSNISVESPDGQETNSKTTEECIPDVEVSLDTAVLNTERERIEEPAESSKENIPFQDTAPIENEEKTSPDMEIVPEVRGKRANRSNRSWKFVVAGLIILLLILIGYGAYDFFVDSEISSSRGISSKDDIVVESNLEDEVKTLVDPLDIQTDSIKNLNVNEKADDKISAKHTLKQEERNQVKVDNKVTLHKPIAVLSDTIEYKITGTLMNYTLTEGETIVKLAKRFYGSKKLWPYIAKHNANIIKDVDKVPIGTELRIPKLEPR